MRVDYIMENKISLNNFKMIRVKKSVLSDHMELNKKRRETYLAKSPNVW